MAKKSDDEREALTATIRGSLQRFRGMTDLEIDRHIKSLFGKDLPDLDSTEFSALYKSAVLFRELRPRYGYAFEIRETYRQHNVSRRFLKERIWSEYHKRRMKELSAVELIELFEAVVINKRFTREEREDMVSVVQSAPIGATSGKRLLYAAFTAVATVGILLFTVSGFFSSFPAFKPWLSAPALLIQLLLAIGLSGLANMALYQLQLTTVKELYDWLCSPSGRFLRWNMGGAVLYVFGVALPARFPHLVDNPYERLFWAILVLYASVTMVVGLSLNIIQGIRASFASK
ncbi:hypothetical protein L0152_17300 [bacterium]|nr:hypothetical protein [bacterium]